MRPEPVFTLGVMLFTAVALSRFECNDSPVESRSGHLEVFGKLRGWFAGVDESPGALDLAGGEELLPVAEVLASAAAFGLTAVIAVNTVSYETPQEQN